MIEVYHEIEKVARFFCAYCFDEHYFDLFKMGWIKDDEDFAYIRFATRHRTLRLTDRIYQLKTFGKYEHLRKGVEVVGLKLEQFRKFSALLGSCGITEWEPFEGAKWEEREKGFFESTLFDNGEIFLDVERFNYQDVAYVDSVDFGWKYKESVTRIEHFRNMKRFLFGSHYPFDEADFFISKEDATKIRSALEWLISNSRPDEKRDGIVLNDGI